MSTELIVNASLPETRIALTESGEIQELLIERASGKGITGNIYKGRVTRVLPGMQAAFVDIGLEKAAFLYVDDVFVHPEMWEEDEGPAQESENQEEPVTTGEIRPVVIVSGQEVVTSAESIEGTSAPMEGSSLSGEAAPESIPSVEGHDVPGEPDHFSSLNGDDDGDDEEFEEDDRSPLDDEEDDEEGPGDGHEPARMGPGGDGEGDGGNEQPSGTIAPSDSPSEGGDASESGQTNSEAGAGDAASAGEPGGSDRGRGGRHRRGRRGGRNRKRGRGPEDKNNPAGRIPMVKAEGAAEGGDYSTDDAQGMTVHGGLESASLEEGESDRSEMSEEGSTPGEISNRPENTTASERGQIIVSQADGAAGKRRPEFKEQRGRDRKIRPRTSSRPPRGQVNIQDLLKEGQEVIVQVAKDPIATKGARLTCHISLPGRHLVCMPTIDHVGVSRRIERDDERRRLRDFVDRNRPKNLGFIVRTASGKNQSEKRLKQDIDYLTRLWSEIREKAAQVTAPAMVYEDLNSVLRAIRDWVTEEIDKIVVDSRYHYNDIQRFVAHFMPSLRQKVELYNGDLPIFDAYGITTELSRSLERKVWLKSGGYLVIDQAEALVAIDVNTGRYVGKKNLEDTILKTNLEAVQEIAYQLRLRNCGGIIILDLIDMEKDENKHRVYRALEEALKKDRARPSILKISELGLVEMTRKRTRDTIIRTLCESCSHCEGKGFIKSKQTVAYEVMREIEREGNERDIGKILVQAHPDVIDILAIDERDSLDQLERRYRKQIYLQTVGDFHPEQFEVVGEKKDRAERARDAAEHGESVNERDRPRDRDRGRGGSGRDRGRSGGGRDRGGRDRNRDRGRQDHEAVIQPVSANGVSIGSSESSGEPARIIPSDAQLSFRGEPGVQNPEVAGSGETGVDQTVRQPRTGAPGDDFYDEEDRLAFLRAQAAQDAAIASLAQPGVPGQPRKPGIPGSIGPRSGPGGQGRPAGFSNRGGERDNGRGGRRRRGRGGRGGRDPRDQAVAPPRVYAPGEAGKIIRPVDAASKESAPAAASSDSVSGTGNGDGGGGDRSTPPVV